MEHLQHIKLKNYLFIFFFFILCIGTLISCKTNKNVYFEKDSVDGYTVYKIDSINNYYLVYLNFKDRNYKIVSKKDASIKCKSIKVGDIYNVFNLKRMIRPEDYIPKNIDTASPLSFVPDCIKLDEQTQMCRERGMDNIYTSDNLKSLCYIKQLFSPYNLPPLNK
ncbi:hypothetical protein BBI01_09175 [Chryseobacterium artocarpi]|uniref:Uncharacterized protein n=1 Tax=Chryseobacterium artocarpi TaxID=1414727 RepID=A0A1B8ZL27_9FLAO|nr:hypothetical protein [Chryseobacterium artocarpi]OCA72298.1 hypothetical protein BBI01_09175 [Chryseobacterium artocarpi]